MYLHIYTSIALALHVLVSSVPRENRFPPFGSLLLLYSVLLWISPAFVRYVLKINDENAYSFDGEHRVDFVLPDNETQSWGQPRDTLYSAVAAQLAEIWTDLAQA